MYDVCVIGGGASGMLASAIAAEHGLSVLLLERGDKLGKKLRITGKGRCNLTNNCTAGEVLQNIPTGGRFLQGALNSFTPDDTMKLFETLGVPLKTERGGRVFPVSDKASDIADALIGYMKRTGVETRRGRVKSVITHNGTVSGVTVTDGDILCKTVIICTGGVSYPATGSTGDGYKLAKELGHTVTPPYPSLVPFAAEPETCSRMQGLTLKNTKLTVFEENGKKAVFEDFGELLFTHFGISGPLTLSASAHLIQGLSGGARYYAVLDLKPALDEGKLDARLLRDFQKNQNRDFINSLGELLPRLMIPVIAERSRIPPNTKVHSVTREQRKALLKCVKEFRIDIERPRPVEEAIITSGGVALREINPKTMESKLVRGLYFAGEVIDADAYTGGFNLQIAWSTAVSAGKAVSGGSH